MAVRRLVIGSDHAGFKAKEVLRAFCAGRGLAIEDLGALTETPVDYPGVARAVADRIASAGDPDVAGILVCGSGIGMSIAANRVSGVRAALCFNREFARLSRQHNNANILVLPGRFLSDEEVTASVEAFLDTPFDGGRHAARVDQIDGCSTSGTAS